MISTVRVVDYVRNTDGTPYDGAVITAQLAKRGYKTYDSTQHSFIGNEQVVAYTNSYGRFELKLVPTSAGEYYFFTIRRDTVSAYRKELPMVPIESQPVPLDALEDVVAASSTPTFIGTPSGYIFPTYSYLNIVKWGTFFGDGARTSFSVPGTIQLVALNGVVQLQDTDYSLSSVSSIAFVSPPENGDLIAIQYKT